MAPVTTRVLVATARPYDVTLALCEAGYEVIYVGEQPAQALLAAAEQEDVAAILLPTDIGELADSGFRIIEVAGSTYADVVAQLP